MNPVVDIAFVSDRGSGAWIPAGEVPAGLTYRLAVIQQTYVPGQVDMYFDESLWLALVDFIVGFDAGAKVTVIKDWRPRLTGFGSLRAWIGGFLGGHAETNTEHDIPNFMEPWRALELEDRQPANIVQARAGETLVLWMATENWAAIGGPDRYHDSWTYSLFSDRDLEDEVRRFLEARPEAARWRMEPVA